MKRTYPAKPKSTKPKTTKKVTKMTTEPKTPAKPQETAAETIGNTRRWARQCHGASTDKAGYPYVVHLDGVARNIYMLVGLDKELIQAGYLHDMIEDTTATTKMLRDNGFSDRVIDIVYAVTKISGEANYDYISFIIDSGRDAMIVKLADLYHNTEEARLEHKTITPTVKERLLKKYLPAIWRIERALIALGENITPTVTFEEAKDACTYKPAATTYAPKWRVSTSPSTVVANDFMKFAADEEDEKFALRVKSKSAKNGEYTFTFHDSDSKVTLKQGDSFWIKWGGGASYKSTAATTPKSSTATPTWTPEWIKYLGLPKDWKDGDPFPDPTKTFRYDVKAKPAGGKGKSSTAPGGVTPLAPPTTPKYTSSRKNVCLECHVYNGHLATCEFFGECEECLAPEGASHYAWCTRGDGTPGQGKDLLVLGHSDDPDGAETFDPDTGKFLGYTPELATNDDKAEWVLSGSEDDDGFGRVDGSINYAGPGDKEFDSDVAIKRTFDDLMREVDSSLDGLDK